LAKDCPAEMRQLTVFREETRESMSLFTAR
jgi:hypothetical protein